MCNDILNYSNIIASLALVVSFVALYCQFFYKKEKVLVSLTNSDGCDSCNVNLTLVFSNQGNQNVSITDCFVLFFDESKIVGAKDLNLSALDPFILRKDEQKIVNCTAVVPELKVNENIPLNIKVKIYYVNCKGCLYNDSMNIGNMEVRNRTILKLTTQHLPYKLSGIPVAQIEK